MFGVWVLGQRSYFRDKSVQLARESRVDTTVDAAECQTIVVTKSKLTPADAARVKAKAIFSWLVGGRCLAYSP